MPFQEENLAISKFNSWRMFDEISPRYDFLNHFLSLGLDFYWRKKLIQFMPLEKEMSSSLLDLATGTADVILMMVKNNPSIQRAVGIDLAEKMLAIGREKVNQAKLADKITLTHGDACRIPFDKEIFDAVTMAFGIRNVEDPSQTLREMQRVLKIKGKALVLEFSLPENILLRIVHLFYLRAVVPFLGGIVSGHPEAYRYLNKTIEKFPYGEGFCCLMREAGFKSIRANSLMGGIATIYVGEK